MKEISHWSGYEKNGPFIPENLDSSGVGSRVAPARVAWPSIWQDAGQLKKHLPRLGEPVLACDSRFGNFKY